MNKRATYHCNICGQIKFFERDEEPDKGFSHTNWYTGLFCWGDWVTDWEEDKKEQINFREFF